MAVPITGVRLDRIFTDPLDLEEKVAATLAVSAAAAQTTPLEEGIYDIWCTVDVYIRIGPTATGVTVANGYLIRAGSTVPVIVRVNSRIGGIAAGAGTLSYHKVT